MAHIAVVREPGRDWKCVSYADDEAACVAEDAIAGTVAEDMPWSDPDFVGGAALYLDSLRPPSGALPADLVSWRRISAGEVAGCDAPLLFKEGPGSGELQQGQLPDRWVLNALALVFSDRAAVSRLFVSTRYRARGLYTFKFWKCGAWRYVHVDDRIPCDHRGAPLYSRGRSAQETGVMLIEKAYAKLHGCYENLQGGGSTEYALRDFLGAPVVKIDLDTDAARQAAANGSMWERLIAHKDAGDGVMGCGRVDRPGQRLDAGGRGIIAGRTYSIVQLIETNSEDESSSLGGGDGGGGGGQVIKLLKIRDRYSLRPWTGPWSEGSTEWDRYPVVKSELQPGGFNEEDEGMFWISFADFAKEFSCVWVGVDSLREKIPSSSSRGGGGGGGARRGGGGTAKGKRAGFGAGKDDDSSSSSGGGGGGGGGALGAKDTTVFVQTWAPGHSVHGMGGSPGHATFLGNPQYGFEVKKEGRVAATLSVRDHIWEQGTAGYPHAIGVVVVRLSRNKKRLTRFRRQRVVARSPRFEHKRDMTVVFDVRAGSYAVIPCTWDRADAAPVPSALAVQAAQAAGAAAAAAAAAPIDDKGKEGGGGEGGGGGGKDGEPAEGTEEKGAGGADGKDETDKDAAKGGAGGAGGAGGGGGAAAAAATAKATAKAIRGEVPFTLRLASDQPTAWFQTRPDQLAELTDADSDAEEESGELVLAAFPKARRGDMFEWEDAAGLRQDFMNATLVDLARGVSTMAAGVAGLEAKIAALEGR